MLSQNWLRLFIIAAVVSGGCLEVLLLLLVVVLLWVSWDWDRSCCCACLNDNGIARRCCCFAWWARAAVVVLCTMTLLIILSPTSSLCVVLIEFDFWVLLQADVTDERRCLFAVLLDEIGMEDLEQFQCLLEFVLLWQERSSKVESTLLLTEACTWNTDHTSILEHLQNIEHVWC